MKKILAASIAAFALASAQAVVINEIRIDHTGTDTQEYFELFGVPGTSLNDYTYIVIGDSTAGGSGVIESVTSLTGKSINGSGYFVAAIAAFTLSTPDFVTPLIFENSDNVTHLLVSGFTGALNADLDTNNDGVLDSTPWTSIVDAVGFVEILGAPVAVGDEYYYGASLGFTDVGPDGTFVPGYIYRSPNGGGWKIGKFDLVGSQDSPGAANYFVVPTPVLSGEVTGGDFVITCPSEVLFWYQLEVSTNSLSGWINHGSAVAGTGSNLTFTVPGPANPGDKVFYRVTVSMTPPPPPAP